MNCLLRISAISVALLAVIACSEVDLSCMPDGDVTPLCGVQMPEDIEVLPNGGGLLIGEYGDGGKLPGALTWLQPEAGNGFTPVSYTHLTLPTSDLV